MDIWFSNEEMAALFALAQQRGELVDQTAHNLVCDGLNQVA